MNILVLLVHEVSHLSPASPKSIDTCVYKLFCLWMKSLVSCSYFCSLYATSKVVPMTSRGIMLELEGKLASMDSWAVQGEKEEPVLLLLHHMPRRNSSRSWWPDAATTLPDVRYASTFRYSSVAFFVFCFDICDVARARTDRTHEYNVMIWLVVRIRI
jgi:hypothetical protein